jgi:peptidoglycan-N-acetylglucosamine deacetylase
MALRRIVMGFAAVVASMTCLQCNVDRSPKSSSTDPTCTGTQALQSLGLRGSSMAARTLALTFDDGPGPRTAQLSRYLKDEGIQATFFVNGRSMHDDGAMILRQLADDGHLVANHTESHRSLTGTTTATPRLADAEIVQELEGTDAKISPFVPSKHFLFRPPFGDYDEATFTALSSSAMGKYVGPILWDVGDRMDVAAGRVADWDCWQDGSDGIRLPMQQCGDLYITEIKRASRGIVLLHDPYYNELDPEQRGTVDMVIYMVPILKQEGFTFVRVDAVPEIASHLPPENAKTEPPPQGGPAAPGPGGPNGEGDDPCK